MEQLDNWLVELDAELEQLRNFKLPEDYQVINYKDEE